MTDDRKIETYKELMAAKGIATSTAAPPLWKLMWSLGINVPPPLYMSFIPLFLFTGSFFGIVFGTGVWVVRYMDSRPMSLHEAGGVALITGIAFGLTIAWFTRRLARKVLVKRWTSCSP